MRRSAPFVTVILLSGGASGFGATINLPAVVSAGPLLIAANIQAQTITDDFTDDVFTQANWTFIDAIANSDLTVSIVPGFGMAQFGDLTVSSDAIGPPAIERFAVGAVGNPVGTVTFAGPYTRIRAAVSWTQQQLDDGMIAALSLRLNLTDYNVYTLNLFPGSNANNFFSLRSIVGLAGGFIEGAGPFTYQPDTVYNIEFGIDDNFLWGKLWLGDNYNNPLLEVSATDDQIPWGPATGNVLAGVILNREPNDLEPIEITYHANTQFGNVFEVVGQIPTINVPADQPTIQAAIDAAVIGDQVLVADGTYNELINFNGKAVTVRSVNGAAMTTINGGGSGPVATFNSGEGLDSVLDGFTITGGSAVQGAGAYIVNSGPTIQDCVFTGNTTIPAVDSDGGGIYARNATAIVKNCTFNGNQAIGPLGAKGGGMLVTEGNCRIVDCIFDSNTAVVGGGIYYRDPVGDAFVIISGCTFTNNTTSVWGGGVSFRFNGRATITDCFFSNNSTVEHGGGLYIETDQENILVTNCTFTQNTAGQGGAISVNRGRPTIANCVLFSNNANSDGGGLFTGNSSPIVFSSTFSQNSANSSGGGIYSVNGPKPVIVHSILWNNNDSGGTDASAQIHEEPSGSAIGVYFSCVLGGWGGVGAGNISADPQFVAGPQGNFYLSQISSGQGSDSPCLNTGVGLSSDFYVSGTTRTDETDDTGTIDIGFHYNGDLHWPAPRKLVHVL